MNLNLSFVRELIEMVTTSDLSSLEIEYEGMRIKLKNGKNRGNMDFMCEAPSRSGNTSSKEERKSDDECEKSPDCKESDDVDLSDKKVVKSPMVGTYRSLEAIKKEPVRVGDKISAGSVICIIEAMKLINEIESEFDGEVIKVLVNDGDMVEFGQPLFVLK